MVAAMSSLEARNGRSRRRLAGAGALTVAALAGLTLAASPARAQDCTAINDFLLVNGKIITGDPQGRVVSSLRILGERIVYAGDTRTPTERCTQVVDLGGRTVIPGLIDSHTHLVIMSQWPGIQMMAVENARDIAGLQAVIQHEAALAPKGAWLSAMGMWLTGQFTENRLPTLAELDAAAPDHPVLLYENIGGIAESFGPAVTNSAGIRALRKLSIPVRDDGRLADPSGANTFNAAFNALQERMTAEDERRSLQNIQRYMLRFGLTGWHDKHGGTNGDRAFRRFSFLDRLHGYDQLEELWRRGGMAVRATMFVSNADRHGLENLAQMRAYYGEQDLERRDLESLASRLDNMTQSLGDDWLKLGGQGEHIAHYPWSGPILPVYEKAARMLASRGWTHEEHSLDPVQTSAHLDAWVRIAKDYPLRDLHWSLAHVPQLTTADADRIAALGVGTTTASMSYTNILRGRREPNPSGPMYRMMVDRKIPVGAGTDAFLGHLNPWHNLYFMTTGLAINGTPVNVSQKISRLEALRVYTLGSAWHGRDEAKLGSLEAGKLADLVVLSDDYLTASDEALRRTHALLTMVGGKIMAAGPSFLRCAAGQDLTAIWSTTRAGPSCALPRGGAATAASQQQNEKGEGK